MTTQNTKIKYESCEYCGKVFPLEELHFSQVFFFMCEDCFEAKNRMRNKHSNKGKIYNPKSKEELAAIKEKYSHINIDKEISDWICG